MSQTNQVPFDELFTEFKAVEEISAFSSIDELLDAGGYET